jgi:hypothetical protein
MNITLNKANRFLAKLKAAKQGLHDVTTAFVHLELPAANREKFVAGLPGHIAALRDKLENKLTLEADLVHLKQAIFAANQTSGLSHSLNELDLVKHKLAVYIELQESLSRHKAKLTDYGDIDLTYIALEFAQKSANTYSSDPEVYLRCYADDEVNKEVSALRKVIAQLEDDILTLNNSTINADFLSALALELLGQ